MIVIYILTILASLFLYRKAAEFERQGKNPLGRQPNGYILVVLFILLIPVTNIMIMLGIYLYEKDFKISLKWLRKLLNED